MYTYFLLYHDIQGKQKNKLKKVYSLVVSIQSRKAVSHDSSTVFLLDLLSSSISLVEFILHGLGTRVCSLQTIPLKSPPTQGTQNQFHHILEVITIYANKMQSNHKYIKNS